jgi:magnesium chelatase family protein
MDVNSLIAQTTAEVDFGDVRGQEGPKRALTIAAAGAHNVIMIGPPGSGKTLMAKALPGILPPLAVEEALEVTRIFSSVGMVGNGRAMIAARPVRTPHHTSSSVAIIGGGAVPRPGEVSLAHHGILFMDELPEFPRSVLETLRQPLEDGCVTIARAHSSLKFPARFMFVGAMNPTPKGSKPTDEISQREMEKYLSRISGPLIDRMDIHVEVPAVPYQKLTGQSHGTDSATMLKQVMAARQVQNDRNDDKPTPNSALSGKKLDRISQLDDAGQQILKAAMTELGLSARAYDKIRRLARTIADLELSESITAHHVAEAVQYRLLDRQM